MLRKPIVLVGTLGSTFRQSRTSSSRVRVRRPVRALHLRPRIPMSVALMATRHRDRRMLLVSGTRSLRNVLRTLETNLGQSRLLGSAGKVNPRPADPRGRDRHQVVGRRCEVAASPVAALVVAEACNHDKWIHNTCSRFHHSYDVLLHSGTG